MDIEGKRSFTYLIGFLLVAAVIIIIAATGISYTLLNLNGSDGVQTTLSNFNNAGLELVTFTDYQPLTEMQGNWNGYYLSSDGRKFYTTSSQSAKIDLNQGYYLYTYQIVLSGFPDNAWGIKEIVIPQDVGNATNTT